MTTTGPFYSLGGRTNQDSGSRVWGGRLRFGRWGLGQWLYIPKTCCVFFRNCLACVVVFVCTCHCFQSRFVFSLFRFLHTASTLRRVSSYSCSPATRPRMRATPAMTWAMTRLTPTDPRTATRTRPHSERNCATIPMCVSTFLTIRIPDSYHGRHAFRMHDGTTGIFLFHEA